MFSSQFLLQKKNPNYYNIKAPLNITPEVIEPSFFDALARIMLIPSSNLQIDSFAGLARLKGCHDFSSCLLSQVELTLQGLEQPEKIRDTLAYKISATPRNGGFTLFGTETQRKLEILIGEAIKNRKGTSASQTSTQFYQESQEGLKYYLPAMFQPSAGKKSTVAVASIVKEKCLASEPELEPNHAGIKRL